MVSACEFFFCQTSGAKFFHNNGLSLSSALELCSFRSMFFNKLSVICNRRGVILDPINCKRGAEKL